MVTNVFLAAVDPAAGLTRGYRCDPPSERNPLWLFAADIAPHSGDGAGAGDAAGGSYSAEVVGAAGLSLADVVRRGAGEVVERCALRPPAAGGGAATRSAPHGAPSAAGRLVDGGLLGPAFGDAGGTGAEWDFLAAHSLLDGIPYTVPAPAVDYPQDPSPDVDATPSCAAAGLDLGSAYRRAMIEAVERDALETAWQGRNPVTELAWEAVLAQAGGAQRDAETLDAALTGRSLRLRLGVLPTITRIPGVVAVADSGAGPLGVGCAVGGDLVRCAIKAGVEALQVHSLLANWSTLVLGGADVGVTRPRSETDRLTLLCSPTMRGWIADFANSFARRPLPTFAPAPTEHVALAAALAAQGVDVLGVDLTERLPRSVRDLGWVAVRVLPLGLQPLRGDDTLPWTWCLPRLAHPGESEAHVRHRLADAIPHPLA